MHRAFIKLREKNHSAGFNFYLTKGLMWKLVFIVVVVVVVCLFLWLNLQKTSILKVKLVM